MITPLLEKYILSGQAVFKNTSIGENGLLALEIPRGSTAIITKIICEPFLNIWAENNTDALNTYLSSLNLDQSNFDDINLALLRRCEYNLKVYSESGKVKINYNLRQEIEVNYLEVKNQPGVDHEFFPVLKPKYKVRELDCFILANETIFFMYSFPSFVDNTVSCETQLFPNVFNQTTPVPTWPNGPNLTTPEVFIYYLGGSTLEAYLPMGKQTTITTNAVPKTNEIYRGDTILSELRVPNNTPPGSVINEEMNYSLPLLNIEYVLINSGLGSLFNSGDEGI
jgi:hypothetical protein